MAPVTFALANGPVTLMSAFVRAVSVSLRAISALSAFNCKSTMGCVNFGNFTPPVTVNLPPESSPPNCWIASASPLKLNLALKLFSAGSVGSLARATLIVMSPEPLNTGRAIVPRTSTSSPRSPSSCCTSGTNCRIKFTELRGSRAFALIGVSSGRFRARAIFGMSNGRFALISSGWILACCSFPETASWLCVTCAARSNVAGSNRENRSLRKSRICTSRRAVKSALVPCASSFALNIPDAIGLTPRSLKTFLMSRLSDWNVADTLPLDGMTAALVPRLLHTNGIEI